MFYAGIDIGGTKCAVVIGEKKENSMKIHKKSCFLTRNDPPEQILDQLKNALYCLLEELSLPVCDLSGIGISCGGPLDSKNGIILSPPNLPLWDNVAVVDYFKKEFHIHTYLQNDANACAVAEWKYGAGQQYSNIIFMTFGTGLGAGLILDGKLYTGANDMAGEVGHIRITDTGPIGYGKSGSLEGYCSGSGIAQIGRMFIEEELKKGHTPELLLAAGSLDSVDAKIIADLADKGDALCRKVYALSGEKLGLGLSLLIDIINPEIIIIGSIFTRSYHLLWESAKKIIIREAISHNRKACKIVKSALKEQVGDMAALSIATGEF